MGWVDTHCHLQLDERPVSALLGRAGSVDWMVVPGIDARSSAAAVELARSHADRLLPSAGLHPHDAEHFQAQWDQIVTLSSDVAAIGETGLDYYRDLSPRDVQRHSFTRHIELALELGKPLIVHCRDAFADVHDLVERLGAGPQAVLHCWTGGPRWTRRFLDLGVTFSFAGPIAFETGDTVRRGAALVPPERAIVETDTPYLAPPPHRTELNEPAWVELVGAALREGVGDELRPRDEDDVGSRRSGVWSPCRSPGMTAQTRSEVRALLERHGLSPRKALGQHFLADPNIAAKIVAVSGVGPQDRVVEVGPGTGALTVALAGTGAKVIAYEIDRRFEPVLAEVTAGLPNIEVRFVDATDVDLAAELDGAAWVMVANLPYNVGTPLVLDALRHVPQIGRFVVMVQVEVARRFVAVPGGKEYGLPSVIAQIHSMPSLAFTVPPQVFVPPPGVGSAVIVMERKQAPPWSEKAIALAAAAFGQRRKMLRRSLVSLVADVEVVASASGIAPQSRAEELTAADYLRMAEVWDG